jgi:hypothetical protein
MKTIRFSAAIAGIALLVCFTSCKKTVQDEEDWQSATDNATVESLHSDADKAIDEQAEEANLAYLQRGPKEDTNADVLTTCATISVDSTSTGLGTSTFGGRAFPRKVTIDFGSTPVLCRGRLLSGKMFLNISKPHREAGSVIEQTFDGFKINGHSLEGTRTRTNLGADPTGHQQFKIDATNCKITDASGKVFSWTATHTRTWLAGFGTPSASDNVVEITGNGSGVNRNGKAFTMAIGSAIHIEGNCKWPQAGVIVVTRQGLLDRTINFGTAGICDDQATISVNGQTRNITLPRN